MRWESLGAPRLHIIDLDGAQRGELGNLEVIRSIRAAVALPLQVGGGIRQFETAAGLLELGVERVILGSPAVEEPELVERLCREFASSIVVSIDARSGYVAIHGWQGKTEISAVKLAQQMVEAGVRRLVYTDIERDGTLTGPNLPAIARLLKVIDLPLIASGGISSLEDVRRLKKLGGIEGVIIGKALYTRAIDLAQTLAIAGD